MTAWGPFEIRLGHNQVETHRLLTSVISLYAVCTSSMPNYSSRELESVRRSAGTQTDLEGEKKQHQCLQKKTVKLELSKKHVVRSMSANPCSHSFWNHGKHIVKSCQPTRHAALRVNLCTVDLSILVHCFLPHPLIFLDFGFNFLHV